MSLGERKGCKVRSQGRCKGQSILSFEHPCRFRKQRASSRLSNATSDVIRLGLRIVQRMSSLTRNRTCRSKWTPSQQQLQILENLFQQGSGTLNKQRVKEVAVELSQYGQIAEKNVKNWFQNRKARAKRKQQQPGRTSRTRNSYVSNNGGTSGEIVATHALQLNPEKSENIRVDTDTAIVSPRSKRPRLDTNQQHQESKNLTEATNKNADTDVETKFVGAEGSTCAGLTSGPPLEDVKPPISAQFHETFDGLLGNTATTEIDVHPSAPDVTSIASIELYSQKHSLVQAPVMNEMMEVKTWDCLDEMLHMEHPFGKSLINCRSDNEQMHFTSNEEAASLCSNQEWRLTSLARGPIPSMDESHKPYGLFERPRNII